MDARNKILSLLFLFTALAFLAVTCNAGVQQIGEGLSESVVNPPTQEQGLPPGSQRGDGRLVGESQEACLARTKPLTEGQGFCSCYDSWIDALASNCRQFGTVH